MHLKATAKATREKQQSFCNVVDSLVGDLETMKMELYLHQS